MSTSLLATLFAENRTEPFLQKSEDWVVVGMLAGTLLVGAAVVYFVDRWRKRTANDTGQSAEELTDYRGMFERGEITEQEYAKLRQRVAQRLKKPAAAPPAAGPPPPEPGANGAPGHGPGPA